MLTVSYEHPTAEERRGRNETVPVSKLAAGTKPKRALLASEDIPWTASRCNRLLRSISSRIRVLKKLAASNRLETHNEKAVAEAVSKGDQERGHATQINPSPSKDPEWLPRIAKPSAATTYGGKLKTRRSEPRIRKNAVRSSHDGLGIGTPFVKRMLRPDLASPRLEDGKLSKLRTETARQRARKVRCLPIKPSSAAEAAYTNLTAALGSFLQATRSVGTASSRSGSLSLMSACLRRMPAYVELEQQCADGDGFHSDDDQDIAAELYVELEAYGTAANGGWSGLRQVVRSDGLHQIRNAVSAGLLPVRIIDSLVTVCCREDDVTAGLKLLGAALEAEVPGRNLVLSRLLMLGKEHACGAAVLRMTSELVQRNVLSLHELCVHKGFWHVLFKSIMDQRDRPEAVNCLGVCLRAGWDSATHDFFSVTPNELQTVQGNLQHAAALLVATAALSRSASDTSAHLTLVDAVHRLATQATINTSDSTLGTSNPTLIAASRPRKSLSPFLIGSLALDRSATAPSNLRYLSAEALLAHLVGLHDAEDDEGDVEPTSPQPQHDAYVSDIALTIGRWDVAAGDTFLTKTIGKLLQTIDDIGDFADVVKRLALSSARAYADVRQDQTSLTFVEEVEDMILHGTRLSILQTPGNVRSKRDNYRWEDGLCEWIARTPFSVGVDRVLATRLESANDAELEPESPDMMLPDTPRTQGSSKSMVPRLRAKRALSALENVAQLEHPLSKQNKRLKRDAQAKDANSITPQPAESIGSSYDDHDELAFSAKKVEQLPRRKALTELNPIFKAPPVKACRLGSLKRSSSGSSSWISLDTSDDELR